jgi:phosphate transport system substrate-binding protein
MNNLMTLWGETFSRLYPTSGSRSRARDPPPRPPALIEGTAQFGPMSRQMKPSRGRRLREEVRLQATEIRTSYDALAVYVHRDNPLDRLTLAQVDAAFSKTRKRGAQKDVRHLG